MKHILASLILLFVVSANSQTIDWQNAPLNPIAVRYKLEHFNLKGDVYGYDRYIFSESGYLMSTNELLNSKVFIYDKNNRLLHNTEGETYKYNAQGYVAEQTYAELGKKTVKFHYNSKDLLIKTEYENYSLVYEYDNLNRLIKTINTNNHLEIEYVYNKYGEELHIEEKKTRGDRKFTTIRHVFKNGHKIGLNQLRYESNYDKYGNHTIKGYSEIIYYSEIKNKPEISLICKKNALSSIQLSNCKFYINNKLIYFLNARLVNDKDVMVYNPFEKNYMIINNPFEDSKEGTVQKIKTVHLNTNTYLQTEENMGYLYYEGISISNKIFLRNNGLKLFKNFNNIICYDGFLNKTFFFKYYTDKIPSFIPLEELKSKDNILFINNGKIKVVMKEGIVIKNEEYAYAYNNDDMVLFKNSEPLYYLPNFKNAEKETIYPGRLYNKATDTYQIVKTNNQTPKINSTCLSGNCVDGYGELKTDEYILKGFFKNGKANGFGKQNFSDNSNYYEGNFVDGFRNGFGMFTWYDTKEYYIGQFKNGTFHGYGYLKKGGEILQAGYYEKGKQTKNMITTDFKNKRANGNCIGNCSNGFGFYQFANRDTYVGFFTNGQLDKVGAYGWSSGDSYIGEIQNKNFSGQGVQYYKSSGTSYYGNFLSGQRSGLGVYLNKNKQISSKGYWQKGTLITKY